MKRKKMNVDEILKRYFPRAAQGDVEAAGDRVWKRLQEDLKKHDTSLRSLYGDGWSAPPLKQREFQVLTAVSLVGGRSTVPRITAIVQDWAGGIQDAHVYLTLSGLEERGLVTSRMTDSGEGRGWPRYGFEITEDGDRALGRAKAEGKELANAREDRVEDGSTERLR